MDWEPQEHEFINHDTSTIHVSVEPDGTIEIRYYDFGTAIVEHRIEQFVDEHCMFSTTVTRIRPAEHLPGIDVDLIEPTGDEILAAIGKVEPDALSSDVDAIRRQVRKDREGVDRG